VDKISALFTQLPDPAVTLCTAQQW